MVLLRDILVRRLIILQTDDGDGDDGLFWRQNWMTSDDFVILFFARAGVRLCHKSSPWQWMKMICSTFLYDMKLKGTFEIVLHIPLCPIFILLWHSFQTLTRSHTTWSCTTKYFAYKCNGTLMVTAGDARTGLCFVQLRKFVLFLSRWNVGHSPHLESIL